MLREEGVRGRVPLPCIGGESQNQADWDAATGKGEAPMTHDTYDYIIAGAGSALGARESAERGRALVFWWSPSAKVGAWREAARVGRPLSG